MRGGGGGLEPNSLCTKNSQIKISFCKFHFLHFEIRVQGGFGTRPWWLARLACGGTYWPLAFEPSAMTSGPPYYCGHLHCRRHPPAWGGIQNATSAHGVLP